MQKKQSIQREQKQDLHRFGVKSDSSDGISYERKKTMQNGRKTMMSMWRLPKFSINESC